MTGWGCRAALQTKSHNALAMKFWAWCLRAHLQALAHGSLLPGSYRLSNLLHHPLGPGQVWVALRALLHPGALQSSAEQGALVLGCCIADLHGVLCAVQQRLPDLTSWLNGAGLLQWWWQFVPCHSPLTSSIVLLGQLRGIGTKRSPSVTL